MRKPLVALFVLLAFTNLLIAQQVPLVIKGYGKDIHLDHKVSPKEGIFSIGRLYNVHPKTIAAYNNLDMAKGLTLGQVIHIPLTDTNFSQTSAKGTPVYYNVGDKETLQKVSTVNNKVALKSLRDWNKLTTDNLTTGKKLVIGFLVTGENTTALVTPPEKKEATTKEVKEKLPDTNTKTEQDKPVVKNDPPKEEPKKPDPIVTRPQVTTDMKGQGYFKNDFDQQIKTLPVSKAETVTSGIFKMNSRNHEIKYYLLVDGITPGTIVRVINPDNDKAVYAKVLGAMSGIRQNQGLDIRISNSAASTLGITDTDKFIVKINY